MNNPLLQSLLDALDGGACVVDDQNVGRAWNATGLAMFGLGATPLPLPEPMDAWLATFRATGQIRQERTVEWHTPQSAPCVLRLALSAIRLDADTPATLVRFRTPDPRFQALEASEQRFRQMAEMAGEWLWEQDPDGRYTYCSTALREILGFESEELLGRSYLDLLTPEDRARQTHLNEETPSRFAQVANRYRHRDGHEVFTESSGEPVFDDDGRLIKWRGVDHDITRRKHYEDALHLRDRAIEAASVGIVITDAQDPHHPILYVNPAISRITGYSAQDLEGSNLRVLQGKDTDPAAVQAIVTAIQAQRACEVVILNYRKDGTPFWNELSVAPVFDDAGNLTHFIGILADVTELRHASEERHELEIAKKIQISLLPGAPLALPGARVAGFCQPATHVGGDYFDFFQTDHSLDMVIADVSGHSVGAALIMAEVRSALRAQTRLTAENGKKGPGHILALLNDILHADLYTAELFISMFYLRVDLNQRRMVYANAGHNCPLLSRADTPDCVPLDAEGLILGVRESVCFEEKTLMLHPGDRVLLYTDGVTEARNDTGEFFDIPRLGRQLTDCPVHQPEEIIRRVVDALHDFRGSTPLADDLSLAALCME